MYAIFFYHRKMSQLSATWNLIQILFTTKIFFLFRDEKLWNYCVRHTARKHALVVPFIFFFISHSLSFPPSPRKYNLNSSTLFSRLMMFVVIKSEKFRRLIRHACRNKWKVSVFLLAYDVKIEIRKLFFVKVTHF